MKNQANYLYRVCGTAQVEQSSAAGGAADEFGLGDSHPRSLTKGLSALHSPTPAGG